MSALSSSLRSRAISVAVVGVVVSISLAACGLPDQPVCSPASAGYGDATTPVRRVLLEIDRTAGPCRGHVDIIRNKADLDKAVMELGAVDELDADFAREIVVLHENTREKGVRFVVSRADVITVGVQACAGGPSEVCRAHFYAVTATAARGDEHLCSANACSAAVGNDPIGSD